MINAYQEYGLDRRVFGKFNATLNELPEMVQTFVVPGDPFEETTAEHFFELLDAQIGLSLSHDYALCLVLVKIEITTALSDLKDAIARTAAHLVSLNLRPTDIVIRYPGDTLSIILHDATDVCGQMVAKRLQMHLGKTMQNSVGATFGVSSQISSGFDRAQKLLISAETNRRLSLQDVSVDGN